MISLAIVHYGPRAIWLAWLTAGLLATIYTHGGTVMQPERLPALTHPGNLVPILPPRKPARMIAVTPTPNGLGLVDEDYRQPRQAAWVGQRVHVRFSNNTRCGTLGTVVRCDLDEDGVVLVRLDTGELLLNGYDFNGWS